jgi:LPXTG-motif cell wall-anchored protein
MPSLRQLSGSEEAENPVITIFRRLCATTFLVALIGVAGAAGSTAALASGDTPNPPGGTIQTDPGHGARVCVHGFQGGSAIRVTNHTTGASRTIRSNVKGRGCGAVPVRRSCHSSTQTVVETGAATNGKPTSVTQTVTTPAVASLCTAVSAAGSTLPFTGSEIIIPGTIVGVALIALGTALLAVRRRRRAAALTS